nr:hypothetical protein [Tanacetum cinerariifolium]
MIHDMEIVALKGPYASSSVDVDRVIDVVKSFGMNSNENRGNKACRSRTRLEWERMFESEMEMFYLVTKMGDGVACEDVMEVIGLLYSLTLTEILSRDLVERYVVPTGRVIVPTGRYVVHTGRVIVATGRLKRTGRDRDGGVIILPPMTAEEHIAIQRNQRQELPCFIKARLGGNAESKTMKKSMLKQEFLEFKTGDFGEFALMGVTFERESKARTNLLQSIPDDHVPNFHYIDDARDIWNAVKARGIAQRVALTLKTKDGLELLSFDDLYYKLKTLEVDTGSHRSSNILEDVIQSFVTDTELEQQIAYKDFEQIEKLNLEEMDLKWKMAILSVRVHKFKKKARRKIDFDKKESARFNKKKVRCYKCQQRDAIKEGAANIYNLIIRAILEEANTAGDAREFALMGVTSEVSIPPVRPQLVPTGKPNVSAPVPTGKPKVSTPVPTGKTKVSTPIPTGRPNRPSLFPTDKGISPSVISGWWSSTARTKPYFSRPTSSYFQTYTSYVPTMYDKHMKYGRDIWATPVKPSAGCS